MYQVLLVDCPPCFKRVLTFNAEALEKFTSLNFFLQRNLANYVANGENNIDMKNRIDEVIDRLKEM